MYAKKHAGNKTKTYKKDIDFGSGPTTCLMSASISTVNLELVKYGNCLELQYWVQETWVPSTLNPKQICCRQRPSPGLYFRSPWQERNAAHEQRCQNFVSQTDRNRKFRFALGIRDSVRRWEYQSREKSKTESKIVSDPRRRRRRRMQRTNSAASLSHKSKQKF